MRERVVPQRSAAVRDGFGDGGDRLAEAGIRRAAIPHPWRRLAATEEVRAAWRTSSLAHRLGNALAGPLRDLEVDPASLPDDSVTDYTLMATAALRHLYPESSHPSRGIRAGSTEEADAEA